MKRNFISLLLLFVGMVSMAQTDYLIIERKDNTILKFPVEDITRMRFEYETSLFGKPAEIVDLGLSVKWASWNMGATKPEEYGSYFYWGDPTGEADKANFSSNEITGSEYDIAHVQWGEEWRLPTYDEMRELIDNCSFQWTTRNGVEGGLFTSKKSGYTNKSIFIPAGGDMYKDDIRYKGEQGRTWCDEYFEKEGSTYGYVIYFDKSQAYRSYGWGLAVKMPVRPVYGKKNSTPQTSFTVTTGSAIKITDDKATLKGNASAQNNTSVYCYGIFVSTSGTPSASNYSKDLYGFTSSNSISMEFEVDGLTENTTYYYRAYVMSGSSYTYGETKSFTTIAKQNGMLGSPAEIVDLGLSVKWASWNMGASAPEESGSYLYWGDPTGTATKANATLEDISGTQYDAAHVNWGDNWRMPTILEIIELVNSCTYKWTTLNGVNGVLFTSKKSGYTNKSIFFPAAGDMANGEHRDLGVCGEYWSGRYFEDEGIKYGYMLYFDNSQAYFNYGMGLGAKLPIRPVYAEQKNSKTYTANGVSFRMVAVEGGTFTMGATSEQGSDSFDLYEKPAHQVTLSDFSIGETEVTQELWEAVMGNNPSYFTGDGNRPVESVSWDDCQVFIAKLNQLTGVTFRLPTEAEWEFAARGGNKSEGYKYSGSNTVSDVAWYYDICLVVGNNSPDYGTHRVGLKKANELGLYDMSGNVFEWCQDWFEKYSSSAQTNPTGPSSGTARVERGGSWRASNVGCRVSHRMKNSISARNNDEGLRLALSTQSNR